MIESCAVLPPLLARCLTLAASGAAPDNEVAILVRHDCLLPYQSRNLAVPKSGWIE